MDSSSSPAESIIDWLPLEILIVIFLLCSRQDWVSLCQTSKLFEELGTCILYKEIGSPSPTSFEKLLQTLCANPRKADAVRHFTISKLHPDPSLALVPALNTSLVVILKCLTRLEKLTLDSHLFTNAYDEMLRDGSFPMLSDFTMDATRANTLLLPPFLSRHPNITTVTLKGASRFVGPIALPNAKYLEASSSFFRSLTGQVPISTAIVSWNSRDRASESRCLLRAVLAQHGGNALTKLICKHVGAITGIIQDVPEYLPNIRTLHISPHVTGSLRNEECDAVTRSLGRLNFLKRLDVIASAVSIETIERWGRACPTLEMCITCDHTWMRKRSLMKYTKIYCYCHEYTSMRISLCWFPFFFRTP
ncbi:hypothetical protein BD779DRAFT_207868 [Infundibulicybe gibba]|nr:hypothetical protein BD779DRAFT_207868 [Infundibulicybe gibba]